MGTWGYDVFDDDLALDIRASFENALSQGMDVLEATSKVIGDYSHIQDDRDEGPILCMVLASLQMEHRVVQSDIQKQAVLLIEQEGGLQRWKDEGVEQLNKRRLALGRLRERLAHVT